MPQRLGMLAKSWMRVIFRSKAHPKHKDKIPLSGGAEGKQNVAIMAQSTSLKDIQTGKKANHVRYFKAKVLDNHLSGQIDELIKTSLDKDSIVFTDKSAA